VIDQFWRVHWHVHDDAPRAQLFVLPFPAAGLMSMGDHVALHGVIRAPRTWELTGSGTAIGMTFQPGAAAAVFRVSAASLTDRVVRLPKLPWSAGSRRAIGTTDSAANSELEAVAANFEHLLKIRTTAVPDPQAERVSAIVEALRSGRFLTRVAEVSGQFHLSARTLQRTFQRHLGVSPKWLLSRYRLLHAATRLQELPPEHWTHLALDLGFFDDSHFARDFARTLGVTPIAFARSAVRGASTHQGFEQSRRDPRCAA
jgi:AraC-like DNA-binding protein